MDERPEQAGQSGVPLLPLRGMIVFPHTVTPLEVGRPRSIQALEAAMLGERRLVLAAQRDEQVQEPSPGDIYPVGTLCVVKQVLKLPEGQLRVLIEGLFRVRIDSVLQEEPYYLAAVQPLETEDEPGPELEALVRTARRLFEQYCQLGKKLPEELVRSVLGIEDPERLLHTIMFQLPVGIPDKQAVLETPGLAQRLEQLCVLLTRETEILEIEKRIHLRVRRQMERTQKEYYLREQMKAIQKELGERDERQTEVDDYRRRIEEASLPKEVREKANHELKRLEKMPPMVAEAVVVRTYLDWLLAVPWSKKTTDRLDLNAAQAVLDEDHYGLEKVKERILEYLAVRKLTRGVKGPILCLVGPPGVGKTSLARSVARALGRKFARISLGGVRDEAEIRGHRRTYVGAMPGKIVHALRQAGAKNPVMLLDEVDKMTSDYRGDPTAALLEVLDPEQNHAFSDHYLEVSVDLSEVLFITTANVLWAIPRPLRDRMEIIAIPGYTEQEKLAIARRHLLPKQVREHGLKPGQLSVSDNTLARIIDGYTREAGVRGLERSLAAICRKAAREVVAGAKTPIRVTRGNLTRYLGRPRYVRQPPEREDRVGLVHGLAYTEYGGDVLAVEVTVIKGKGKLMLTGKLGEIMRESAQAGFSYIRSRAADLSIEETFHESVDVHIHIPEGAVPKDGPSAGIAIATALASALSGRAVRHDVAMTGEITLRGRVLAVGGIKEKVLAAHRHGIRTVILPRDNEKDLEDIPAAVRRRLDIRLVDHMDDVLDMALIGSQTEPAADVAVAGISPAAEPPPYVPGEVDGDGPQEGPVWDGL
ncbi:MAG: endopeptidase La [Firmicutes bacterium]|nr:endopeptidase La [Bacillota bacterium]